MAEVSSEVSDATDDMNKYKRRLKNLMNQQNSDMNYLKVSVTKSSVDVNQTKLFLKTDIDNLKLKERSSENKIRQIESDVAQIDSKLTVLRTDYNTKISFIDQNRLEVLQRIEEQKSVTNVLKNRIVDQAQNYKTFRNFEPAPTFGHFLGFSSKIFGQKIGFSKLPNKTSPKGEPAKQF